jgi:hypothetical protein
MQYVRAGDQYDDAYYSSMCGGMCASGGIGPGGGVDMTWKWHAENERRMEYRAKKP